MVGWLSLLGSVVDPHYICITFFFPLKNLCSYVILGLGLKTLPSISSLLPFLFLPLLPPLDSIFLLVQCPVHVKYMNIKSMWVCMCWLQFGYWRFLVQKKNCGKILCDFRMFCFLDQELVFLWIRIHNSALRPDGLPGRGRLYRTRHRECTYSIPGMIPVKSVLCFTIEIFLW